MRAYLTIDDSPTTQTDALTDFLAARDIPAVLYCVGGAYRDLDVPCTGIENNPAPLVRAIEKGFVLGNHLYSHSRASTMRYEDIVAEIEKTERLIDGLYRQAGIARPVKLLRFPHLDRGMGGWIVDYDQAGAYGSYLRHMFGEGLNITLRAPTPEQRELKARLQDYLAGEGFADNAFEGVHYPWYADTEMAAARDALYTFSTSDWMLNPAFESHAANWPFRTTDALKTKIDSDPYLLHENGSANIILMHDQEGLLDIFVALITHMQDKGVTFLPIGA